jgi:hypothetical protein
MKLMFLRRFALLLVLVLATGLGAAKVAGAFPVAEEKLNPTDPLIGGEFGRSVAIDGDFVAVGPPDNGWRSPRAGSSYVFKKDLTSRIKLPHPMRSLA